MVALCDNESKELWLWEDIPEDKYEGARAIWGLLVTHKMPGSAHSVRQLAAEGTNCRHANLGESDGSLPGGR